MLSVGQTLDDNGDPNWSHGSPSLWTTYTHYDVAGRVQWTQNAGGQETYYEYDAAGKQTKVTVVNDDGEDTITEYRYEGNQRVWVQDARSNITQFVYDDLGRLTDTYYPATAQNGQTSTHAEYDELGRRTAQTDQAGRTRWFDYDPAGRLIAVILPDVNDPNNSDTPTYPRYEYKYDTYGNLTAIWDNVKEDPNSGQRDANDARETKFVYNELNKQIARILPDGRGEYKEYDEYDRLTKATDFKDQVTAYIYGEANSPGLLEYQRYYASETCYPNDPNLQIHFEYDNLGRKETVTVTDFDADPDDESIYQYWYDAEGRVEKISSPQGWIVYDYWPDTGQRKSVYTPENGSDSKVDYYYDYLNRLDQVLVDKRNSQDVDESTYYTYNEVGSLKGVEYANSNYAYYKYDALNRLTNLINFEEYESNPDTPTANVLSSFAYTLADDGQRTKAVEIDDNNDTTTINWTYDALNRLVTEDYNAPDAPNDFAHTYVYDMVGNRLEKQVTDGNTTYYTYDADTDKLLSEITGSNSITYTYNDNGSLIYVDKDDEPNLTYTYGYHNRQISADNETKTITYKYNAQGIRIEAAISGGSTSDYLIDPYNHTGYAQVFKEKTTADPNYMVYIFGHDVVAQAATTSANTNYFLYDGHGSVRHLANTGGDRILKYTSAGVLDTTFDDDGIVGQSGTGDGEFDEPWAIDVDFDGYIYVTDSNNNRVQIFDNDGEFVKKWGEYGDGDGQLNNPSGFCLFDTSEMYLADTDNYRIQRFSRSGYFLNNVGVQGMYGGNFDGLRDVCYDIDYDQIIVADSNNDRIQIFQLDSYGDFSSDETTFVMEVYDPNFCSPMAVACAYDPNDPNYILYVADTGNNRIVKLQVKHDEPSSSPVHVFEGFKTALATVDINKALTFFIDSVVDDYEAIFNENSDDLQDMVDDMGEMSLSMRDDGMAVYELSNSAGTKLYPVIFTMDEGGNWKISKF